MCSAASVTWVWEQILLLLTRERVSFGKNLGCPQHLISPTEGGFITREAEHHDLPKLHVCSGHGPSLMEGAGIYIGQVTSGNTRERPSVSRARQLDAIRPLAKVK